MAEFFRFVRALPKPTFQIASVTCFGKPKYAASGPLGRKRRDVPTESWHLNVCCLFLKKPKYTASSQLGRFRGHFVSDDPSEKFEQWSQCISSQLSNPTESQPAGVIQLVLNQALRLNVITGPGSFGFKSQGGFRLSPETLPRGERGVATEKRNLGEWCGRRPGAALFAVPGRASVALIALVRREGETLSLYQQQVLVSKMAERMVKNSNGM